MKRLLAAACVLSIVAACKAKKAPGEIILAIDSDLTPGVDFDELHVDVISEGVTPQEFGTIKEFGQRSQPNSFPMTFAVVYLSAKSGHVSDCDLFQIIRNSYPRSTQLTIQ